MNGRRGIIAASAVLIFMGGTVAAMGEPDRESLEEQVREIVDQHARPLVYHKTKHSKPSCNQAPGGIVGVYFKEKTFYFPYGQIDTEGAPPTPQTIFGLGSVTKTFTVSILGQRKELFDQSVTAGPLPPGYHLQPSEAPVTFEQLATFTGGIVPSDPPGCGICCDQERFVAFINSRTPPKGVLPAPNVYSNSSIGFIGQILMYRDGFRELGAKEANRWYDEHLFSHLGMSHTSHPPKTDPTHPLSTAFGFNQGEYVEVEYACWSPWGTAGRMFSTAEDMVRFIMANVGVDTIDGKKVPEKILDGMKQALRPWAPPEGESYLRQGFAWVLWPEQLPTKSRIIGKDGGLQGVSAYVAVNPDLQYGVVTLLNMEGVDEVQAQTIAIMEALQDELLREKK